RRPRPGSRGPAAALRRGLYRSRARGPLGSPSHWDFANRLISKASKADAMQGEETNSAIPRLERRRCYEREPRKPDRTPDRASVQSEAAEMANGHSRFSG